MGIDFTTKNFGDIFYKIRLNLDVKRPKIIKVDSDGTEWYRYDKLIYEPFIEVFEYCGNKIVRYSGITDGNNDYPEDEYYMKNLKNQSIIEEYDEYVNSIINAKYWYDTLEETEKVIEKYREQMLEYERKH